MASSGFQSLFNAAFGPTKTAGASATLKPRKPAVAPKAPVSKAKTTTPVSKPASGGSNLGGGGTTAQAPAPRDTSNDYDPDADARRRAKEEEDRKNELIRQERAAITEEFNPVFEELDRRIGRVPGEKAEYTAQIADMATSQAKTVGEGEKRGLAGLGANIEEEKSTAKQGFQALAEDVRNNLQAKSLYLGAAGAGDSSAVGAVSEAITKGALKARTAITGVRDKAITQIKLKMADVSSLAREQEQKIETWKSDKLLQTATFFNNKIDELESAKSNASVEKARAITNVIRGLNQQFVSRLQQIDDQVSSYKQSVALWTQQRAAELEDYATKLSISSQYSSGSGSSLSSTLNNFAKVYGTGALDLGTSAQLSGLDLTGLQLDDAALSKKKESFEDTLAGSVAAKLQEQQGGDEGGFVSRLFGQ